VNLVSNIGFGIEATHTLGESEFAMMPVADIGELQHPTLVARDKLADMYTFETCFLGSLQKTTRNCWCGNTKLIPFGPDYLECRACGTLVSQDPVSQEELIVKDDETDFYGKEYWFSHQTENFGFPDIYVRARNDLTERNLHWLKTLLKYRLPPAQVLELGCSHGSFVALLRQAGYQASGVEMSPWVVTYAHETFDIPVEGGPVESLSLPKNSLDIIVLMDVMEHLSDPLITIEHCISLLKSNGLLLIQMPEFQEEKSYESLSSERSLFLNVMLPREHLHLFSKRSVKSLFARLGIQEVYFEPAIFDQYDMFLIAAKQPIKIHSPNEIESTLLGNPSGRMVLGMLDLRQRELEALNKVKQLELDLSTYREKAQILTRKLETNQVVKSSESQANHQLQSDLQSAQSRIEAMESSKFWKLRNKWMGLKRKFGLSS
jgi:2-polyprenyl-3-methyl-5-hydroxy-6-metoxy-1,4-benzoquinol methylase